MPRIKYKSEYFTNNENAVHLDEEDVQSYIDKVVNALLSSNLKYDKYYVATGDTIVFGFKYDDEINIYVTQNYSEACFLKNENNEWEPINWKEHLDYSINEYEQMSREQLIDEIMELRKSEYNPRKEV